MKKMEKIEIISNNLFAVNKRQLKINIFFLWITKYPDESLNVQEVIEILMLPLLNLMDPPI